MYTDNNFKTEREEAISAWPGDPAEQKALLKAPYRSAAARDIAEEVKYVGSLNWLSRSLYLRCEMGLPGAFTNDFIAPIHVEAIEDDEKEGTEGSGMGVAWLVDRYKGFKSRSPASRVFARHLAMRQHISEGVHLPVIPIPHDNFASRHGYEKQEWHHPMFFSEKYAHTHGIIEPGTEGYPDLFKLLHQPNFCHLLSFLHYVYEWSVGYSIDDITNEPAYTILEHRMRAKPHRAANFIGLATLGEVVHQFELEIRRAESSIQEDRDNYDASLEKSTLRTEDIHAQKVLWANQRVAERLAHHKFPGLESTAAFASCLDERKLYEMLMRYSIILHKVFRSAHSYNHSGPSTMLVTTNGDEEYRQANNKIERNYHLCAWPMWIYKFPFTTMKEHFYTLFASLHPYHAKAAAFFRRPEVRRYFTQSELRYLCSAIEVTVSKAPRVEKKHIFDKGLCRRIPTEVVKSFPELRRGHFAAKGAKHFGEYIVDRSGNRKFKVENYVKWMLYSYEPGLIPYYGHDLEPGMREKMQEHQAKLRSEVALLNQGAPPPGSLSLEDKATLKEIFDQMISTALPTANFEEFQVWLRSAEVNMSPKEFIDLNDEDQWMACAGRFISMVSQRSFQ